MNRPELPERLVGLRPVRAPAGLRDRAMSAASTALRRPSARMDPWSRICNSRSARWIWAGAVVVFFVGHLVLSFPARSSARAYPLDRQRLAGVEPEIEPLIRLSRIKALPEVAVFFAVPVDEATSYTRGDAGQENGS